MQLDTFAPFYGSCETLLLCHVILNLKMDSKETPREAAFFSFTAICARMVQNITVWYFPYQ
jgi:hypothetical protein